MDTETIQIIKEKKELLSKEVDVILFEFFQFLNSTELKDKEPQDRVFEIVDYYFEIDYQYRDRIDTFLKTLKLPSSNYSYALGITLNNILNERYNEFRKLLLGHEDSAYISLLI